MALVVEKDAGRELQIEGPTLNFMVGSNERWKWWNMGRELIPADFEAYAEQCGFIMRMS